MSSLQKKIQYGGVLNDAPVKNINLEFNIPSYKYFKAESASGEAVDRKIVNMETVILPKDLDSKDYHVILPDEYFIGEDAATFSLFKEYLLQSANDKNMDNITARVGVRYFADKSCLIGEESLDIIYLLKLKFSPDLIHDKATNPIMRKVEEIKPVDEFQKTLITINKTSFVRLHQNLTTKNTPFDEFLLLFIISYLTEIKDGYPFLNDNIDPELKAWLSVEITKNSISELDKIIKIIQNSFDLYDFPLTIPEIKTLTIGGTFTIVTSDNSKVLQTDFSYYELSAEYSADNGLSTLNYVFPNNLKIEKNSVPFSFTESELIIRNCFNSPILVKVKGFDKSIVWSQEFKADDPGLKDIKIEVSPQKPNVLVRKGSSANQDQKLRGQVIDFNKNCPLKDLTVVIQAKIKEDEKVWRIVGAAQTDNSGNFSMPYPYGNYALAQAIVSLTPNDPADIPIISSGDTNKTIADDFLYLLLKDVDCPPKDKDEDCDCHTPKKASRLPDQADLIESDEYSQDLGGTCLNLSTPNRTLSEFNYQAIVRTSDPDVTNYVLEKAEVGLEDIDNSLLLIITNASTELYNSIKTDLRDYNKNLEQFPEVYHNVIGSKYGETMSAVMLHMDIVNSIFKNATNTALKTALNEIKTIITLFEIHKGWVITFDGGGWTFDPKEENQLKSAYSLQALINLAIDNSGSYVGYKLVGGTTTINRQPIGLNNPMAWQDAPDAKNNLSFYQAVTIATGHILHYKSVFKADGYSLGDLIYSLPLAPGQKKEIVVFDSSHSLQGAESQSLSQSERLSSSLVNERDIINQLGGNISEAVRGSSSANTSGISAGFGTGGSGSGGTGAFSGSGSAVLGVAGGVANSNSSASQDSSRDVSQFFGEKLRQSIMQNADSYRQLNTSVVTTVQEGQRYGVTTEVVANHNHCHALTMMYFEVLRHYAIFQELSSVEECVFVPLLMTNFTTENIYKWRDVLAQFLLTMASETYLQPFSFMGGSGRNHPLLKAFDANERIKTQYANVDFPQGSFDNEQIRFINGEISLRVELKRPKTRYDRILTLPIVSKSTTTTNATGAAIGGTIGAATGAGFFAAIGTLLLGPGFGTIAGLIAGAAVGGSVGADIGSDKTTTVALVKKEILDSFVQLDANYETVPPAQCIRITNFQPSSYTYANITISISGADFFSKSIVDKQLWTAYATILGYSNVFDMLDYYFKDRLIAEWDEIYNNDIAPVIFDKIVDSIRIETLSSDMTSTVRYKGAERWIRINLSGTTTKKRNELPLTLKIFSSSATIKSLKNLVTLNIENVRIVYSTSHYNGLLYSGNIGDDLLDGTELFIPENSDEKKNPRKEDAYLVYKLMEHLNSNLEYYNKVLWYNLDPDRMFMLLDGFNIEVFKDDGTAFNPHKFRSLASVVKNALITVTGNSLVFPVAPGYKVSQSYITEETPVGEETRITLFDHYKPLTPIKPYRISVSTKGVFAEAIQGACNACEKIETQRLQDWTRFPNTDEPTSINAVTPPTPTVTDWKAAFKDFATPIVNIQNAPATPAPGIGLAGLSELLGKNGVFTDITGLDGNQKNVLQTYLSNQENAKAFAQMAKEMAMQSHNTQNSDKILDSLKTAKDSGALSQDDYGKLVKDHLQQQIDGGESKKAELDNAKLVKTSLTDAAVKAAEDGKEVKAQKTDNTGNSESIEISGANASTVLAKVAGTVPNMTQKNDNACWATAATMMMSWKAGKPLAVEDVLTQAGNSYLNKFNNAEPLYSNEKQNFITALNMTGEPPADYSLQQYIDWIKTYGPLWITTDAATDTGIFSPHARILTQIVGTGTADGTGTKFIFNDPLTGTEQTESFSDFITSFEQMVTDSKDKSSLFIQIVHFKDKTGVKGEGGEPVLTQEQTIAKLKKDSKLDFTGKKAYLDFLMAKSFTDALQSLYNLSKEVSGFDTMKDLLDRTSTKDDEKNAFKEWDAQGLVNRIKIMNEEDIPGDLNDTEKVNTAAFFADQMEINRNNIQTKYLSSKAPDTFTLQSFPNSSNAKANAKSIIYFALKFNVVNKKQISYLLATANGESRFLPIMEYSNFNSFKYADAAAQYYYSIEFLRNGVSTTKLSYNSNLHRQTQLSDYLVKILTDLKYIKVTDLAKRIFTSGDNIDVANFDKLTKLLTINMSAKDAADKWTDIPKNIADTSALFSKMAAIVNTNTDADGGIKPEKIITDDILMNADFFRYAGKGFVQVTWKDGYAVVRDKIKTDVPDIIDLENNPEQLLNTDNAVYALVLGLKYGAYGDHKIISDHFKDGVASSDSDWQDARKMVNGTERNVEFAECGKVYYDIVFRGR